MTQNIIVSSLDKIPNHIITETTGIIFTYINNQSFDVGVNNLKSQATSDHQKRMELTKEETKNVNL